MKNVIEDLLDGEKGSSDKIVTSEEYGRLQYEVEDLYDKLLKALTKEQTLMLENFYNKMLAMQGESSRFHYKEGFKLGFAVAIEAIE